MTQHRPSQDEGYGTRLLSSNQHQRVYKVVGQRRGHAVNGQLTIKLAAGEPDGFDWQGTELDEDTQQAVLDLFAD